MAESDVNWVHAGISEMKDGRIRIPDRIFDEAEILTPGLPVHWSYEAVVKIVVLSNQPLDDEKYETEAHTTMGDKDDNYRCTVPSEFFRESGARGDPEVKPEVPESAQVREGERRHFMYSIEMAEGNTRSCYVLTDQEFSDRFQDSDIWDGTLDQVPKFL
jgi:hypothetical protein